MSSNPEHSHLVRRGYAKNALYAFAIMSVFVAIAYLFPPFAMLRSYVILTAYLVGGAAAGYYFSQDLDSEDVYFQTRYGIILWAACAVAFIIAILAAGTASMALTGRSIGDAFMRSVRSILSESSATTTAASLVLGLLGIALGRDIYLEQFTMLAPLSRQKAEEIREVTHSVQPLIEARHRYGKAFSKDQLSELIAEHRTEASLDEVLSDLMDRGVLEVSGNTIRITDKGNNLLSISRFVGEVEGVSGEGDVCAYCGRPIGLSEKVMRINYYGKPYVMHYSEREGVRIFGRLPYIDKVLGLKPAEVSKPVYERANVVPTIDHKAVLALGLLGAAIALGSYGWMMLRANALPVASEVSFFGATLLSVSLIFAACGLLGGAVSYLRPGTSYGAAIMLALAFFALPFIAMTRHMVFGGYYASVGLIAIGGVIALKAHTRIS